MTNLYAKFDIYHSYSAQENTALKFFRSQTLSWPANPTHHYTDPHFFPSESRKTTLKERIEQMVEVCACGLGSFGSNGSTFPSDSLETGLDRGDGAAWTTGLALEEEQSRVLLQNGVTGSTCVTRHVLLCKEIQHNISLTSVGSCHVCQLHLFHLSSAGRY